MKLLRRRILSTSPHGANDRRGLSVGCRKNNDSITPSRQTIADPGTHNCAERFPLAPGDSQRHDQAAGRTTSEAQDAEADADPDRAVDPRVQAMLPPDLLQPGEIILLLLKPSAWSILLESLKTIGLVALVVACCIWAEQFKQLPLHHNDTLLAATTLISLRLFWEFLDWMGRVYILTDRRVVRVQGVSRVQVFEAPLKKIDHAALTFSNRERVIGLGTVVFHLFDHPYNQLHWRMIAKPGEVYPIVVNAIEKYR